MDELARRRAIMNENEQKESYFELRITMPPQFPLRIGTLDGKPLPEEEYMLIRGLPVTHEGIAVRRVITYALVLKEKPEQLAIDMLNMYKERDIIRDWEVAEIFYKD
jgi:hypothetical protein